MNRRSFGGLRLLPHVAEQRLERYQGRSTRRGCIGFPTMDGALVNAESVAERLLAFAEAQAGLFDGRC